MNAIRLSVKPLAIIAVATLLSLGLLGCSESEQAESPGQSEQQPAQQNN